MIAALRARGEPVRALVRPGRPAVPEVETVEADAADAEALERAAAGARSLVLAARPPLSRWEPELARLVEAVTLVAERAGTPVVFPTTVDGLKTIYAVPLPADAPPIDHNDRPTPVRRARRAAEDQLQQLAELSGVRVLIVRSGDWFGPGVDGPVAGAMVRAALAGRPMPWFGPLDVGHGFTFVEDVAAVAAALLVRPDRPTFEVAPVGAHYFPDAEAFAAALARAVGRPVRARRVPGWSAALAGLLDAEARAFAETRYQWEGAILLDDTRTRGILRDWQPTPLEEALARTVAWFREAGR